MKSGVIRNGVMTLMASSLVGCLSGGGGTSDTGGGNNGGSVTTPVVSTLIFNLQSAYITLAAYGLSGNFTVSGSCAGTGSRNDAPAATLTTFENVTGLAAVGILDMSFSNCTPNSETDTYTNYYDSNYVQLGYSDGIYGVYQAAPSLPDALQVGDTGTIGTMALYADSSKGTGTGTQTLKYAIEADTADTAIVNLITEVRDAGGGADRDRAGPLPHRGNRTAGPGFFRYPATGCGHLPSIVALQLSVTVAGRLGPREILV